MDKICVTPAPPPTYNELHIETVSCVGNHTLIGRGVHVSGKYTSEKVHASGQDERRERDSSIGVNVYHRQCPSQPPYAPLPPPPLSLSLKLGVLPPLPPPTPYTE